MYDQGGFPQAELRPGRLPTTRITTREPTHKQNYDQGAGWQAGWLAELRPGSLLLLLLLFLGVVGIDVGVFVYYFEEKSGQDLLLA